MKLDSYKELSAIAAQLQNEAVLFDDKKAAQIGLHNGLSGVILALADIRKEFPELINPEIFGKYIERAYAILAESEVCYPSFSGGLAGYAFLLQQLAAEHYIDGSDYHEVIAEIDEIIIEHLENDLEGDHLDILHGAIGMALYLIDKEQYEYAEKIIDRLDQSAIREGNRCYWRTFDYYKTQKYRIDFGLAHGNAGIQFFLGKCLKKGIKTDTCTKMLNESLAFYQHTIQDVNLVKSYYPTIWVEDDYLTGKTKPEISRVAWCYGDLGILFTHLLVADALQDELLKTKTIQHLIQVAGRRTEEEVMYNDAGFCHGTCGLVLLFKNAYDQTGEGAFREASEYWLQKTYDYKLEKNDQVAYSLYDGSIRNETDPTLLEGLAGVAASYLSVLSTAGTPLIDKAVFIRF
ncbi:lanthionine synthetase LanC family protein [Flavobacterium cerinum]|uniref:Lanthionine synthetase n=1 Tax=Flavobacterium cerinum TaxID=2502784 RepID=A0ABY5IWN3_9FLAO|nr:lanthionine synthetase LanC family protein [Flavobacterium cerinum]UUC47258.1 hypothetical protein NOX80_08675 [Flavobacterium cerinum]